MKKRYGRQIAGAAARSAGYILAGLSAIFLAVALSVLFAVACASEDIGEAGVSEGDFLIIWKPAYLFSVPAEGDLVLFRPEETFSGWEPAVDTAGAGLQAEAAASSAANRSATTLFFFMNKTLLRQFVFCCL